MQSQDGIPVLQGEFIKRGAPGAPDAGQIRPLQAHERQLLMTLIQQRDKVAEQLDLMTKLLRERDALQERIDLTIGELRILHQTPVEAGWVISDLNIGFVQQV